MEIWQKFKGSLGLKLSFFTEGRKWAVLYMDGKEPSWKDRLFCLMKMGARIQQYFFNKEVGMGYSKGVLFGWEKERVYQSH